MKKTCSLATMNSWLVMLITLVVLGIIFSGIWLTQQYISEKTHRQELRSEIENLYYYLKKEPVNLEMFTVLREGDSVSLSVWNNHLSTTESTIKEYEKNLTTYETSNDYKSFPEVKLIPSLRKILETFKNFRIENQERVEVAKAFSKKDLEQLKQIISEQLKQFITEAKAYQFDLR